VNERPKDPPNLIRVPSFSLERLVSHTNPGPAEESETFVRLIYEQRRIDVSLRPEQQDWSLTRI
jgi:hypothetical protein